MTRLMRSDTGRWIAALALAALVSYWTSRVEVQSRLAAIEATAQSQFHEILRRLAVMQDDIRELRRRP